ncbi:DNA-directed RNA polymerase subunit alpha C-terminal domain-containing protein [Chryseobacterium luquanense]|uniref:Helix-hairpin-helix domain-containing protein n=1 Tax=Chryseobacterium luquanense TaxID=2983766 RepID=A0ABT3Y775_9FLAO|nr:DNA-directed RNA polymerase subunit alpha C-terminal domain-containing protein [Chryseobacterium luquanense]MCX8534007.1 helix-hairpin-helix domain-containing protein [Chryseobacterium luquanense]
MINLIIMAKCLSSICIMNHVVENNFLKGVIAKPARRALEKEKINSLEKLSEYSEKELLQMHGFGKNTVEKLKLYMKENHLSFKNY